MSSCQFPTHILTQHVMLLQAGNLAHLLNHSCQPNCHSRLITVWDAAAQAPREHVMLFARVRVAWGSPCTGPLDNRAGHQFCQYAAP
jgi:SET domain